MTASRRAPSASILSIAFIALVAGLVTSCRSRPADDESRAPDASVTARESRIDSGQTPRPCDGTALTCAPSDYCVFTPGLCGKGKKPGTCRPKEAACAPDATPVCGCDGNVYPNACDAQARGIDLDVTGGCRKRIPDKMPCGAHFCDAHTSYCEIVLSDVFELPSDYTCKQLPKACVPDGKTKSTKDCSCFPAGTKCLSFCGPIETGGIDGFHLTCRL